MDTYKSQSRRVKNSLAPCCCERLWLLGKFNQRYCISKGATKREYDILPQRLEGLSVDDRLASLLDLEPLAVRLPIRSSE